MEIRSFFITILIVAFALLHHGEAIKCYNCDSRTSKTCTSEPLRNQAVDCPNLTNNCGVCNYKLSNGTEILSRGCYILTFSQSVSVDKGHCMFCSEDFCNNSNMATVSMTALGCLVSFWAIRFIFINSY